MRKILLTLCCLSAGVSHGFAQQFKISYPASALNRSFTGKVYLYLSKNNLTPKEASIGLEPLNCFVVTVKDVKPGQEILVDDRAIAYPVAASEMERGKYYIQAVWDLNTGGRSIAGSPGNIFSKAQQIVITKDTKKTYNIIADQVIPEQVFQETEFVKELKVPSKLLSSFHHKEMTINAAVQLPAAYYKEPNRKFAVQFVVFGYGSDYHRFSGVKQATTLLDTVACIRVFLDGNNPLGHSAYANSKNTGPWGDALTKELIPLLEQRFRCNGARLLGGHSSGGWSALWLQTHYPDLFIACAASSPDFVDFRSFSKVNLYQDSNLYYNSKGEVNPWGTVAGRFPFAYLKDAYQVEHVISRGEQQHSFDAVFGGKDADGRPESLVNTETGTINKAVAEHWKEYDISLYLRTNWDKLKKDLDGKIRISIGNDDNFSLNYSVKMLEEEMKKINAGVTVVYYPGDHFTLNTPQYGKDLTDFQVGKYAEWLKNSSAKSGK